MSEEIQDIIEIDDSSPLLTSISAPLLATSNVILIDSSIEISPLEIGSFQDGFCHIDSLQVSIPKVGFNETSTEQRSISEISPLEIGSTQIDFRQGCISQICSFENSTSKIAVIESSIPQNSTSEIRSTQVSGVQGSEPQIGFTQVNSSQISTIQIASSQIGSTQIGSAQINFPQIRVSQLNLGEISLPGSVSLQQFLSSYTHLYTSVLTNTYKDNLLNLFDPTFNITLQITDLPTGQLAEAQITQFDSFGSSKDTISSIKVL